MNDAMAAGWQVVQGSRDLKNADTAVSTCYSVCYWMLNRFYNGGREALGLSALIGGRPALWSAAPCCSAWAAGTPSP